MYGAVDKYLEEYDGQQAYELVKKMISEKEETNVGLECRLAHACYILSNFCLSKEDDRCHLLEEEKPKSVDYFTHIALDHYYSAYAACKIAYETEPKNTEVLKWSAIITGTLAELSSLSSVERVAYAQEFKKFLDQALVCSPDSSVYHMKGRFCYRMATLSEEEKQDVLNAFGSVPPHTVDEALYNLQKAEELNPGHIDNLIYLAKCYIAKGDEAEAQKHLVMVLELTPADEIDKAQIAEAQLLLTNITENDAEEQNKKGHLENLAETETNSDDTENTTGLTSSSSGEELNTTDSTVLT
uniref:Uncharacterized protein n=1 Tax=Setaria digitata TaxID=48799 RepID=A0A915PTE7_9BILA